MNKGEFRKNLFEKGAVLDPIECSSEVHFGLCMKLTITGVRLVLKRINKSLTFLMPFSGGYILVGYNRFKRLPTAINFTAMALLLVAVTIALRG